MYYRGLPNFEYLRPSTLAQACSLLAEHQDKARVLAGGTDLLVQLKQRLSTPRYIIGLKGIPGLDYIGYGEKKGLTVGALTTVHSLVNSPLVKEKYAVLAQAAREISALPLHHMSTVGGNICLDSRCIFYNQSNAWRAVRAPCFKLGGNVCHAVAESKRCYAVYQGDLAPILLALDARVKLSRAGEEKVIPLAEFFSGQGEKSNVLEAGEILTEIQIPPLPPNTAGSYQKLRIRQALDFPLAGVAVVLTTDGQVVCQAKVVIGAVASAPLRVPKAEEILQAGKAENNSIEEAAQEAFKQAHPVENLSIPASYRRKMIKVLLERAVKQALALAQGRGRHE